MLLYNAQEPTDFESYQEQGDIGFLSVAGAQFDTFKYEDLSTSRGRNLDEELLKEVHKVHDLAPEMFGPSFLPAFESSSTEILKESWRQATQGNVGMLQGGLQLALVNSIASTKSKDSLSSDWQGIIEPNLEALRERFPDANIRNRDEIDADIAAQAKMLRDDFEETYSYADPYAAFFGALGGGAVASMADPINIMTLPIGAGKVAGASFVQGLSIIVARSFGIGFATEAAIQPLVYDYKKEIESPYDLQDALFNMSAAGVGNGLLNGLGHSIARGFDRITSKQELPNTHETRRLRKEIQDLLELQTFADETGAKTVGELEVHLKALNTAMADIEAGRQVDYDSLGKTIEAEYLELFDVEVNGARATMDYIAQKRYELEESFDPDLYAKQEQLQKFADQKLTKWELKQAQNKADIETTGELNQETDLDAIREIQKADFDRSVGEDTIRQNEEANIANNDLRASRRDEGDMIALKQQMDDLDKQYSEQVDYHSAAKKARDQYVVDKAEETNQAIAVAPTDTPRMMAVKTAVNRIAASMGANDIKVRVYEDDFQSQIADPDSLRFSKIEDIDLKESDMDKLMDEIPYIDDFSFLEGKTVRPTLADLTDAGVAYTGIDSSQVDSRVLQGGPDFPFLLSSIMNDIVWAVQGKAVPKKMRGSDYVMVLGMSQEAHQSNATVTKAVFDTLEAYIRDKRISKANIKAIDEHIRKKFPDFKTVGNVKNFDAYAKKLTFEKRAKLVKEIASAKVQDLGAPSVKRILKKLISKEYSGYDLGDAMVIIKVDPNQPTVKLGEDGTREHDSYKYGLKGKVVGRLRSGVKAKNLFPELFEKRRGEGKPESGDNYALSRALPVQTITKEMLANFRTESFGSIASPRQLKLSLDMIRGNWRDSGSTVKNGGVSVTDFVNAVKTSEASATLTPYVAKEVKKDIKKGTMNVYQLGDSEIFFATQKGYSHNKEYGMDHPELGPDNIALVGVVNNETSAKGVGAPSVVLKAIEEGVTVLDAYAVKSARHPNGYLPDTYGKFGFEEVARTKFDQSYSTPRELEDLKKVWSDNGWNESDGYPDIVVMKWRGSDDLRQNATRRFDAEDFRGADNNPARGSVAKADAIDRGRDLGSTEEPLSGAANLGNDTGSVRASDGSRGSSRAHSAVREALDLDDTDLSNLGVSRAEINEVKDILGVRYSMEGGKAEAAINPETGELHINASAFRNEAHLMQVMREEIIGHYGLRKSLGGDFQGVINDIKSTALTNPELRQMWVDLSGIDPQTRQIINPNAPYKGMADDVIADEIISKMAREEVSDTTFMTLKNIIIKALRKIGLVKDDITISEMRALVVKSEQALKKNVVKKPTITGMKPQLKQIDEPLNNEAIDAEAARIVSDETTDQVIFDQNGNTINLRDALMEDDNDIAGIESIRVCML